MNMLFVKVFFMSMLVVPTFVFAQNPLVQAQPKETRQQEISRLCRGLGHMSMAICIELELKKDAGVAVKKSEQLEELNPSVANDTSIAKGELVYQKHCLSCHGFTGKGDGGMSGYLARPVVDLTKAAVQDQTDEALYKKITDGNYPMPVYEKYLTKEELWNVVNYLRTLSALDEEV